MIIITFYITYILLRIFAIFTILHAFLIYLLMSFTATFETKSSGLSVEYTLSYISSVVRNISEYSSLVLSIIHVTTTDFIQVLLHT